MSSSVIDISSDELERIPVKPKKKIDLSNLPLVYHFKQMTKERRAQVIHSFKVGFSLVLVSLLYLLDPLYEPVGDKAMWAIMTVVVVFEFFAGATISKGVNRAFGTILGGGLGCLAAAFAQQVGGFGDAIIVASSVFVFGAAATYIRLIPKIKKKYDYGALIFILTFNLVVVSGIRAVEVLKLARERLSTIVMGFAVCVITSLLVFPIWASDELHESVASKFNDLATAIEGCVEEYFRNMEEKKGRNKQTGFSLSGCKSVMHSKMKDESLANFARWEPWHGKFGFSHPWNKYLQIGELLRDLATTPLSLQACLQSPNQSSQHLRQCIKEPCEVIGSSLAWILRELGDKMTNMKKCNAGEIIVPKLKSVSQELSVAVSSSRTDHLEDVDGLSIAIFLFSLMEMMDKIEEIVKEVEELGKLANFLA